MLTPSVQGRAALVEDGVRIGIRELLRDKRLHIGDEHSPTTHTRHVKSIQNLPTLLSIATAARKFTVFVCEHRIACVAPYGKHGVRKMCECRDVHSDVRVHGVYDSRLLS